MTPRVALPDSFLRLPIAHRAYHDRAARRPENSRAAIRAAMDAGYAIEIDIQPSGDGMPMVFHDYDLRRLTGRPGRIRGLTAAELGALPLLDADEGIPTLAEVLALVGGQVPLLIEIKDQDGGMGPDVGPLEAAVAEALRDYRGDVALMSFNPHSVAALAEHAPDRPRGITTSAYRDADWPFLSARVRDVLRDIPDLERTGSSFVSHEASDLDRPLLQTLKCDGIHILTWTIRSPEAEAKAREVARNVTFESYPARLPT